ncbi:MAG: HAD-IC family P-type ATPase, partial [Hyphomicrobium sp.]
MIAPATSAGAPSVSEHTSACCGGAAHSAPDAAGAGATARDPVCGMTVPIATAKHTAEHDGANFYFCHAGCRTKFLADPQRYLAPASDRPAAPAADPNAYYICPMDPEVRQIGPGTCPICGMALEPELVALDSGPNPELVDFKRRLTIGLALTLPVFLLEMGGHVFGMLHLFSPGWSKLIQLVLATPVVLWAGWPFLERGWASLASRNFNMFTLIALGTMTAWGTSIVATLLPGIFPPALRDLPGGPPVYFEAAAVITVLVLLGQVLELKARDQTGDAIRALLRLTPEHAMLVREQGGDEEVALDTIVVGNRLRVRPGDTVPLDGVLVDGTTEVDQSMVTGEPMPVDKQAGDRVIGGTVNGSGSFVMRAEKVGRDTLLARIVQMVSEAQRSRAPVQRLADRVSGWFVPLVVLAAILAFLAWWQFGP